MEREKVLISALGNNDLLDWYGDLVLDDGRTIREHWQEAKRRPYPSPVASFTFAHLRQLMLRYHKDWNPEDENWR